MGETTFVPLFLITVLAAAVPLLSTAFRRIQIPIVVGEILVGMIIGRSGLNLVHESPSLAFLAEFGFAFLMFLSGLEVDFTVLVPQNRPSSSERRPVSPVMLGSLIFMLTVTLSVVVSFWFAAMGLIRTPILMGLILSTTSLGVVVPVLKERRMISSAYGQTILVSALLADFATLLLISVVVAIQQRGLTPDLLLVLVLVVAFFVLLRVAQALQRIGVVRRVITELSSATAQIRVRGAFALIVLWVMLAQALGLEIILGAFLAGALVSLLGGNREAPLREKLEAIGFGFFIPIFFIMVGVRFDLGSLVNSPAALVLLPVLLVAAYVVKVAPALLLRMRFSWREALSAGLLLSSRLSLIIAASAIALELGTISEAVNSAIILVAIVTCTASPLLFLRFAPRVEEKARRGVVIVGASELGLLVARRLAAEQMPATIVGRDEARIAVVRQQGFAAVHGDPLESRTLEQAGIANAEAVVSVSSRPEVNWHVCSVALHVYGVPTVVAWADRAEDARALQDMGVLVVQPAMATALALEGALRFPSAFDLIANKEDEAELGESVICDAALDGVRLRHLTIPGGALLIGIRRDGEVIVPHGDTRLRLNDVVMLVGPRDAVREACEWFEGRCK
ncbi:MAG: cation:proton antiporter [Chloroflexi bacterium]|nr:cation:proton antiporter [Chloroflexota bacterium]